MTRALKNFVFGAAGAALIAGATTSASAISIGFDPDGGGSYTSIDALNWNNDNVLSVGAVPLFEGAEFDSYYHAQLNGFQNSSLTLGDVTGEITVVARFRERVTSVTLVDLGGGNSLAIATFQIIPDANGFIEIYHDDLSGGTLAADQAAGTGYNDGHLILRAEPVLSGPADATFTTTFHSDGSVTGVGVFDFNALVTSFDSGYFDLPTGALFQVFAMNDGNLVVPFDQAVPSAAFWDGSGYVFPNTGAVNGFSGPDFQFEAQASTNFDINVVPEPVTSALGLMSLGALGVTALRRRR